MCFKNRKKNSDRERGEHRYKKMAMNKYLSIITLNVNGLNAPIKKTQNSGMDKKT